MLSTIQQGQERLLERRVFVKDASFINVGDHWKSSIADLAFQAADKLVANEKPDGIVVANALSEFSSSQHNLGPIISNALLLDDRESIEVEAAGASGASAVHLATCMIRSGKWNTALVVGVEKMRDIDPAKVSLAQVLSEESEYSQFFGISLPSLNALIARVYMAEYNVSREKLSSFPVISHRNASTAEHAQFKKKFTAEDVSRSEIVSDPLRVLDCAPVGDGAAAIYLSGSEDARENNRKRNSSKRSSENGNEIEILASESATNVPNFFEREKMLQFSATNSATDKALRKAGADISAIDLFEIHDSYSIGAALSVEAIGLSKAGQACNDAAAGKFDLNGQFPISTFGGMKGRGYPLGASGVYQICEAFLQLKERAGFNQVPNAKLALVQTMSGIDSSAYVHILGRVDSRG